MLAVLCVLLLSCGIHPSNAALSDVMPQKFSNNSPNGPSIKKDFIDCALGRKTADLVITNVKVFHLTDGSTERCDIAIYNGKIVGLGSYTKAEKFIDGSNLYAVPGFIDSHVHLESSHLLPQYYEKLVLPLGVTTAFCDPHELANVAGEKALEFFFDAAQKLDMTLRVNLSSCVPATPFETAGAEISASIIEKWHNLHPESRLAELMNVPGLLNGDPEILAKAAIFERIDGHCPLTNGKDLNACAAAGVVNCHESTGVNEATEKLRRGFQVLIREGSAAKDLDTLLPLITVANSPLIAFCSDDRSPLEIINEGHIDSMIRRAIAAGADPLAVYRAASWSAAMHYGLYDRGLIAPGKRADIVLLSDLKNCTIKNVLVQGKEISTLPEKKISLPPQLLNTVRRTTVSINDFNIHTTTPSTLVIEIKPNSLITGKINCKLPIKNGKKLPDLKQDIIKLAVLERHGKNGNIGLGFVRGLGIKNGAVATTNAHDSHNICVAGSSDEDMAAAVNALISMQGGLVVVKDKKVIASVPFPIAGLLSELPSDKLSAQLHALAEAARTIGCTLEEPFQLLSFLALPVIPHLKLTDKGLFDVDIFQDRKSVV